jgi:hypothetical protein
MLNNFVVVTDRGAAAIPLSAAAPSRAFGTSSRFGELARNAAAASVGVFVSVLCVGGEGRRDEAAHTSWDKV